MCTKPPMVITAVLLGVLFDAMLGEDTITGVVTDVRGVGGEEETRHPLGVGCACQSTAARGWGCGHSKSAGAASLSP